MGEHLPDVRPDYKALYIAQYAGAFDLSHEVDLAVWYADQAVRSVQCVNGTYSDIGIAAPDIVQMVIEFEDRCVACIHLNFSQHRAVANWR